MYSIGDEMTTPVMYQDLAQSSMGMMMPPMYGMYGGMGMYGSFYPPLAGVNIQRQPTEDSFNRAEKTEKNDMTALKTIALAMLGIVGFGFLKFKKGIKPANLTNAGEVIEKSASNWFGKVKSWLGIKPKA